MVLERGLCLEETTQVDSVAKIGGRKDDRVLNVEFRKLHNS
jgi:hypothetical protein